jgi:hypothetical protein
MTRADSVRCRAATVRERFLVLSLTLFLFTGACGYHVSGQGNLMPKNVKTLAIQSFGNVTPRYKLARLLPADLHREFISRTRYTIVNDPGQADAILTGTLSNFAAYPTIFDSVSGRATKVDAVITLQVTLTNRVTGAVIFNRPGYEFRERFEISIDPKAYFDESGTAMERLSRDVARSVVSAILNSF